MVLVEGPDNAPKKNTWYHAVWFVIAMLLFVGPFGLPLLFKSDRFSRPMKVIITVLVVLVTVYVTKATVAIMQTTIATYDQLFSQM